MKQTSALIALTLGLLTATTAARAEKYCKSIDQSGNATYTLAPETGCKKKFKTVGVRQFEAPASTAASTANSDQNTSSNEATSPASSTPTTSTPTTVDPGVAPTATTPPVEKSMY